MKFDKTINLGHVIILAGAVAGFAGTYHLTGWRLETIEKQNSVTQAKLDKFSDLFVQAAVARQRMDDNERRIGQLEARTR